MSRRLPADVLDRAAPMLVKLADQLGITEPSIPTEQKHEALRELLDAVQQRPYVPVLVEPHELFATKHLGENDIVRVGVLRSAFTLCLGTVREAIPASRYRSLCETALEQACMWAIKAVSRAT